MSACTALRTRLVGTPASARIPYPIQPRISQGLWSTRRGFGLSRPRTGGGSLERLEVWEGKQLRDDNTKDKKLEEMTKGVFASRVVCSGGWLICRETVDDAVATV